MKTSFLRLFFLMSFGCAMLANSQQAYVPATFILKFRAQSEQYQQWKASDRHAQITEVADFVGAHTTEGYLSDATLHLLQMRYAQQNRIFSVDNEINSLERIAIVHVAQALNLEIVVAKMNKLDFVEFVELMPARYTCSTPNDSLFADAGQYYVKTTKASDAWDLVPANSSVLIAIVDTGVDYNHEDLRDVIYSNPGETGKDTQGNDKRTNGIDDDKNGFVDDWHGWDFAGASIGSPQDNDPIPGYLHGTHCAGIAGATVNNVRGIAGTCNKAKLLAVKIGTNNADLLRAYEGIAYAAGMGASVISCSWGGPSSSQAEQEVINSAVGLGSLVVVAAGNNGLDTLLAPAAYKNVLSVAAVGKNDAKASFSNYGSRVGISAPGVFILSTVPGNGYDYLDGTSMATPVVAGAAGMVHLLFPTYTPKQIAAQLRATADKIDAKTGNKGSNWMYKLGSGRVNVLRALTVKTAKVAEVIDVEVSDPGPQSSFDIGHTINIAVNTQNLLAPLEKAKVKIELGRSDTKIVLQDQDQQLGLMSQSEIKSLSKNCTFVVPDGTPENFVVPFNIVVYDDTTEVGRSSFITYLRTTYRTLKDNNITITVNSRGNFAFNDYSGNFQGEGFKYKNGQNYLFEAGLMIGSSPTKLSDVVRGNPASSQDSSFRLTMPTFLSSPGVLANTECTTKFTDKGGALDANVSVDQTMLQYKGDGRDNFVISVYDIKNNAASAVNAMYCGIYADWDIDVSGSKNLAIYDSSLGFYYVKATGRDGLPWAGMQLLTKQPLNIFMMDNDGATTANPGVYDNFTAAEKFATMSSGIARAQSNIADVSAVIGAGPFAMASNETVRVAFSFLAGMNLEDLKIAAKAAREAWEKPVSVHDNEAAIETASIKIEPNPANLTSTNVRITLSQNSKIRAEVIDVLGNAVFEFVNNQQEMAGTHIFALNSMSAGANGTTLRSGTYFVRLHTHYGIFVEPFIVLP